MKDGLVDTSTGEVVSGVLVPANLDMVADAFDKYQEACKKLLKPNDYIRVGDKEFKVKSAWRKLATAYCISTRVVEERREVSDIGDITYHFLVRAQAANGRYSEGVGSCTHTEAKDKKGNTIYKTEHDTRATAQTRATNRAISDLIGAGEVSAEEVDRSSVATPSQQAAPKKTYGKPEVTSAEAVQSREDITVFYKLLKAKQPQNYQGDKELTSGQEKRLFAICKSCDVAIEDIDTFVKKKLNLESKKNLSQEMYSWICGLKPEKDSDPVVGYIQFLAEMKQVGVTLEEVQEDIKNESENG